MNKGKINKAVLGFIAIAVFVSIISGSLSEGLFIETENGLYKWLFTKSGEKFSLNFIHSVQRTPVIENFVITDQHTLRLESTVYQSLGVGLPFLPEEGKFRQEGGKFLFEGMNREFNYIELRTGPEAKLTLIYKDIPYYLYDTLPYASLVRIRVETLGSYLKRKILIFLDGRERSKLPELRPVYHS